MLRRRLTGPAILAALAMMVCVLPSNATTPAETPSVLTAIWRTHSLNFDYHSNSVQYSCASLRSKIGNILLALGAHESVRVEMQCGSSFATHARAQIVVTTPVEATKENVRSATDYDAHERLVARMRQIDLPSANDLQRFPAQWRKIALSRDRKLQLNAGDCDLLRGMHEQVFPKLSIQITRASLNCSSSAAKRARPTFEVMALVPLEAIPVAYVQR
jgi:hypothetical protein